MNQTPASIALAIVLIATLAVLALRSGDERAFTPRNHASIAGAAVLAFWLVNLLVTTLAEPLEARWMQVAEAFGLLTFLAADRRLTANYGACWRRLTGGEQRYTGPERRRGIRPSATRGEDSHSDEASET